MMSSMPSSRRRLNEYDAVGSFRRYGAVARSGEPVVHTDDLAGVATHAARIGRRRWIFMKRTRRWWCRWKCPGSRRRTSIFAVTGDTLTIHGERTLPATEDGKQYLRVERGHGAFHRAFTLGMPIDQQKVECGLSRWLAGSDPAENGKR